MIKIGNAYINPLHIASIYTEDTINNKFTVKVSLVGYYGPNRKDVLTAGVYDTLEDAVATLDSLNVKIDLELLSGLNWTIQQKPMV